MVNLHAIMLRYLALFALGFSLVFSVDLYAAVDQVSPEQLKALQQEIQSLQGWLKSAEGQRSEHQEALAEAERDISVLLKQVQDHQDQQAQLSGQLDELQNRQVELKRQRDQQALLLRRQIRAAYAMGRQEYLKVLLNQEAPDQLARVLRYYDYLNRERATRIASYLASARELRQVEGEIIEKSQHLNAVTQSLRDQSAQLAQEQEKRQQALAALEQNIQDKGGELDKLLSDQVRLEKLLTAVEQVAQKIQPQPDNRPFRKMRGQLPWPLDTDQGVKVLQAFGSEQYNGKLRSRGLLLEANLGQAVRAVHSGRVVFSDWLRGFGLMVILDHGTGYMSLYGHNQTLLRDTGAWVHAGEVIATAGNTGGQKRTALYFEIRYKGRPTDPVSWVAKR